MRRIVTSALLLAGGCFAESDPIEDDGAAPTSDGTTDGPGATSQTDLGDDDDDATAGDDDDDATAGDDDDDDATATGDGDDDDDDDDDTTTTNGATDGGPMGGGVVDIDVVGCSVDFSGEIHVSYNGSLGVSSIVDMGGALTASLQFDLVGPDTFELSTQHRIDTGTVINLVDPQQGTWTNLDSDSFRTMVDDVSGTLDVTAWAPAQGVATVELVGVSLVHVGDGTVCTIDGTLETTMLYP